MKVLQLGKFYPIKGGVEKVMEIFTVGLAERGFASDMLCASHNGETTDIVFSEESRIFRTKTLTKLAATMISPEMIFRLRRICSEYDIIHVHHPDPMATLALFFSGYRGKVVLHWHSDILKQKFLLRFFSPFQSWLIRRADLILGTTPVYVEESPFLRKVQEKTSFLPIGVDPYPWLSDEIEAIRAQYPGKKIIFNMGRLVPYKGYHHLIEAMTHLSDDYVLLIGGDGPLRAELLAQTEKLGLQERVKFLGFISDKLKPAYFAACDVFCLSSTIKRRLMPLFWSKQCLSPAQSWRQRFPNQGFLGSMKTGSLGSMSQSRMHQPWQRLSIRYVMIQSFGRPIARVLVVASMTSLLKMR